jgi:hypothetical protein
MSNTIATEAVVCLTCKSWTKTFGCNDTNWTSGKLTNPADPVCGGLSFKKIPIVAA